MSVDNVRMHIDRINTMEFDSTPIMEDETQLKVWINCPDKSRSNVHVRVDLKWVSLNEAVLAIEATNLVDLLSDNDATGYGDSVLVTKSLEGDKVTFCCMNGAGKEFYIEDNKVIWP